MDILLLINRSPQCPEEKSSLRCVIIGTVTRTEDLIRVAGISVTPPKRRQRVQRGDARRKYKIRRRKIQRRNRFKIKMKTSVDIDACDI